MCVTGYLGCFIDKSDRDLPHAKLINSPDMNHDMCKLHCYNSGYIYAGLQVSDLFLFVQPWDIIFSE